MRIYSLEICAESNYEESSEKPLPRSGSRRARGAVWPSPPHEPFAACQRLSALSSAKGTSAQKIFTRGPATDRRRSTSKGNKNACGRRGRLSPISDDEVRPRQMRNVSHPDR